MSHSLGKGITPREKATSHGLAKVLLPNTDMDDVSAGNGWEVT